MVFEKYSWVILDDNTAIKHTDLSFFKHHGSGIPVDFRKFFEINNMDPGENRYVTLLFDGQEFKGLLKRSRSTTQVTQILWYEDLSKIFNSLFPGVINNEQYPDIQITKITPIRYELDFVDHYVTGEFSFDQYANDLENEVVELTKEGKKVSYYTTRYERNPKNRKEAIDIHGTVCMACGFDFEKTYGERGKHFIEVHHIVPLCSKEQEMTINPDTDLICVCSNCHRMIHRSKNEVLTLDQLREIISNQAKAH